MASALAVHRQALALQEMTQGQAAAAERCHTSASSNELTARQHPPSVPNEPHEMPSCSLCKWTFFRKPNPLTNEKTGRNRVKVILYSHTLRRVPLLKSWLGPAWGTSRLSGTASCGKLPARRHNTACPLQPDFRALRLLGKGTTVLISWDAEAPEDRRFLDLAARYLRELLAPRVALTPLRCLQPLRHAARGRAEDCVDCRPRLSVPGQCHAGTGTTLSGSSELRLVPAAGVGERLLRHGPECLFHLAGQRGCPVLVGAPLAECQGDGPALGERCRLCVVALLESLRRGFHDPAFGSRRFAPSLRVGLADETARPDRATIAGRVVRHLQARLGCPDLLQPCLPASQPLRRPVAVEDAPLGPGVTTRIPLDLLLDAGLLRPRPAVAHGLALAGVGPGLDASGRQGGKPRQSHNARRLEHRHEQGAEVVEAPAAELANRPALRGITRLRQRQGDAVLQILGGPTRREHARGAVVNQDLGHHRRFVRRVASATPLRSCRRTPGPRNRPSQRPSGLGWPLGTRSRKSAVKQWRLSWEDGSGSLSALETPSMRGGLREPCPMTRKVSCGAGC